MGTRTLMTLVQSYMPYYLQETLFLSKEYIAVIPLVQFIAGFLISFTIKPLASIVQKYDSYHFGCILLIIACIWAWFLRAGEVASVFCLATIFGLGTSIIW